MLKFLAPSPEKYGKKNPNMNYIKYFRNIFTRKTKKGKKVKKIKKGSSKGNGEK